MGWEDEEGAVGGRGEGGGKGRGKGKRLGGGGGGLAKSTSFSARLPLTFKRAAGLIQV